MEEAFPPQASWRVFCGVDNEATRAGLIQQNSEVPAIKEIIRYRVELLAKSPCFPWYFRVPSASNIADPPSRGLAPRLSGMVAEKVRLNLGKLLDETGL